MGGVFVTSRPDITNLINKIGYSY